MSFELQPYLMGRLVILSPLRAEDFEGLYAVASDPLIWEQHPQKNRYERSIFESFFKGAMDSGGAFLVTDTETGEVIGSSRYYEYDAANSSVVIGYTFLARKYWGHRHNREMKHLMLKHAFRFVERVYFHIGENNTRSRKAIEKIGAQYMGPINFGGSDPSVIYQIDFKAFHA
ncbi:MAG: GNAT family N-acetyltransferase [Bdellovibrionia bacterium]